FSRSLQQLRKQILSHPHVVSVSTVNCYLSSMSDSPIPALQVKIQSITKFPKVVKDFQQQRFNLYNIDINPRQQFFLDTHSFPMGACHIITQNRDLIEIQMHDDPSSINYSIPPLVITELIPQIKQHSTFPTFDDPLTAIDLITYHYPGEKTNRIQLKGSESEILLRLVAVIQQIDPDIVLIERGDQFVMNYLAHRAAFHQLTAKFILGRLPIPLYSRDNQKAQTYMTYGQIMRKDQVWFLPGRIHIDGNNSFLYYEAKLDGLIDLTRMGSIPLERTSRSSIGSALTGIEYRINATTIPPTLIKPNKPLGEIFKPSDHLLIADNGGLIYPAKAGIYQRVWAIDFTSLYPMIMAKHNIGNETVLCDHDSCSSSNLVPELGYHICNKKIGIVPRTMFEVLQKRLLLKQSKKQNFSAITQRRYKGMDAATKWILVSCFGYLGFKNARWGSIESHQCVTAYARRYLHQAMQISESAGFKVIAGITDSLFIQAKQSHLDNQETIDQLVYRITRETSIPIDTEGCFSWVVFCNIRNYADVSALNRYYGYFDHNEFKLRGIRLRQRRVAQIERDFQKAILEIMSQASTVDEFVASIPTASRVLGEWQQRLRCGDVNAEDLVIKLKSHVGVGNYKSRTHQALTAQGYLADGRKIDAGENMYYLVRNDQRRDTSRITIGPKVTRTSSFDADWYCKLLENAFLELIEPVQHQQYGRIKYRGEGMQRVLDEFE
ncbi:MAG: hypothetical protein OEZ01_03945, partial [Candidatus Heimdallarchaeota archaeon]|nr:hypothetical protein [Candidatus Heimdallarchaeota archaeon]